MSFDGTLTDHFRRIFDEFPEGRIFRFLAEGEGDPISVTNSEMETQVRAIAATLQERFPPGERALIVCPPGLDYAAAFLACLYSGVIAVPVYPPDPAFLKRTLSRLIGIIEDARPAVVLAPASITSMAGRFAEVAPALGELSWLSVDEIDGHAADAWRRPDGSAADIAFLQYTSGSTSRPKGVMVGHGNLVHNLRCINRVFGVGEGRQDHMVTWLPPYHDMGLIAGVLAPLFGGYPVTIMSPFSFLKRPVRWLRAITDQGGTLSGAPNFAYDLCVAKTTERDRRELDLSGWKVAFSGAEPIRLGSLERFAEAFEVSGFRMTSFLPSYGLAEGTLAVSSGDWRARPVRRDVSAEALTGGDVIEPEPEETARPLIGCGRSIEDQQVAIVDPLTRLRLPDGRVGEIWVSGPSVARGYWERPELSEEVFRARIADTGEGPFLRTGDLGFLDDGELYVTGRSKDVIIIAGRNHYPQDIELAVEKTDPALQPHAGVAGSREIGDEERLVVVQEIAGRPAKAETDRIISAIRATLARDFGLEAHIIALVGRGQVPKTSSGKLQRAACLDAFFDGALRCVATWSAADHTPTPTAADAEAGAAGGAPQGEAAGSGAPPTAQEPPAGQGPSRAEIEEWLAERLAERLGIPVAQLDRSMPIAGYGLRSVDAVTLVGDLEQRLGRSLPATLVWEYPTIEALADHLAGPAHPAAGATTVTAGKPARRHHGPGTREPIAIVGIGCRFPGGANGPESFWKLLCEGRDAVGEVPAQRWNADDLFDEDPAAPGRTNSRWGGFIDHVDAFDPQFFGISPQEAERMDPQQRVLAEVAWEAMEDAGIPAERLAGSRTGVFIGISSFDYATFQLGDLESIDAYTGTGSALSIAANRLSYLLDLRGPSIAVDTACSSSLVAVLQACAGLERGDCDLALAGGVNLILSPAAAINFSKAGVMAPDGRCKPFDARADGYVRSEGAGIVVLKPLGRALADHDTVYGVIRGGAVNQDGRSNGIMAPNPHAQEAVLRAAYADAGVRPEEIHYAEAHGTGTMLGDPIEAKALAAVVAADRDPAHPCLIGSVKSNLGHMEAAAGIGGLIKAALMLRHRTVPPSLHYEKPNPHIPFKELGIRVADTLQPWPSAQGPALVGVSSFGFGGTNAHLVLEEAPEPPADPAPADDGPWALPLSARSEAALRDLAARYEERLAGPDPGPGAHALAHTAAVRRTHHDHRLACVGSSRAEFRQALAAFLRGEEAPGLSTGVRRVGRRPRTAFVFSGQGPRWWPLATDLLATEPVFRSVLERCDALLRRHADWSLLEQLVADRESSRLRDPHVGQPALCAVQVALATLWRSWGVEPAAVVGHSVGEIAAAHVSGALTLEDALRTALHRGQVIRSAVGAGRMAVAGISADRARRLLADLGPGPVWIAAHNGPTSTVLSGEPGALEELVRRLEADGVFCRLLESVGFGSHSPLMEPMAAELWHLLSGLAPRAAAIPMVSTVTGGTVEGTALDAEYWASNLSRPVLFDRAVRALADAGHDVFVEVSPHPMLGEAVAERMEEEQAECAVVASLHRDGPGRSALLAELGRLYSAGYPVDWSRIHGPDGPRAALPSYPWQRQRHWIGERPAHRRNAPSAGHPALQDHVHSATEPTAHYWSARVDLSGLPYLRDHRVDGAEVLPASFVLDAALAAARQVLGDRRAVIEEVSLSAMTVVSETAERPTLQLVCFPETADTGSFRLFSRSGDAAGPDWAEAARGRYRLPQDGEGGHDTAPAGPEELRERCRRAVTAERHYTDLTAAGLPYGPAFRGVDALWRGEGEAVARLREPDGLDPDRAPYTVHPALLDSCLQVLASALHPRDGQHAATYVPVGVARFALASPRTVPRWAHARIDGAAPGAEEITGGRVVLYDESGARAGEVSGITLRRLERGTADDAVARSLLGPGWRETPRAADGAPLDASGGRWLLLADGGGVAAALRSGIEERGGTCVTVVPGPEYRSRDGDRYEIDPEDPEHYTRLVADLGARSWPCAGVVHAWALDAPEDGGPRSLWTARDGGCVSVLRLVQALARTEADRPARLVLLTRGVQRVGDEWQPPALAQAGMWGLARVLRLEHGELRPLIVDLDPAGDGADGLLEELLAGGDEDQLALRNGRRYAPRLEPWAPSAREPEETWRRRPFDAERDGNHRLLATRPGVLDSVTPTLWKRTAPGPGEVEIEVDAAGVNFNDVLKAMDICPGVPSGTVPLGAECAGRITAVGEGVEHLRPGDEVMAVAPSSMARYTTTKAALVAPRPARLTARQAAAVPIAYLTAVYGLEYLARLREGETLLIHSATGGVGLAALQVARRNGAEVLATAGTEEKRELLRGLGVRHVMDSRSLRFADEVRELTGGRGVDVVLNSLAGEALVRSLSLLAPGGRFVEIGKQDVHGNSHLGLGALRQNRSFFAVDLEVSLAEQPALITRLMDEVVRGFAEDDFAALPVTGFGYSEAPAAFAHMAKARHTGKIVLSPGQDPPATVAVRREGGVREDATYLITGGLGALGLETARYLADQGARHLALAGRGVPAAAEAVLAELRDRRVEVRVCRADVSRAEDVAALLDELDASMPPLAGLVHAAGVLRDGLMLHLDPDSFRAVAEPKALGAWHLHRACEERGLELDFFVMYSSAAALLGSASQANYAAANAFLDTLALHRTARGLPALSINWGPWAEAGLAARPDRGGALSELGIVSLRPQEGIAALDRLLPTASAQACVLPLDRDKLRDSADSGLLPALLTDLLDAPGGPVTGTPQRQGGIRRKLLAVEPGRRRRNLLTRHCREEAARVLKLDPDGIDPTTPLTSMGFDSLLALELRKRLESSLQVALPATLAWRYPTIDALVPFLAERMDIALEGVGSATPTTDAEPSAAAPESEIDLLSEEELAALLLAKTKQIDEGRSR